MKIAIEGNIGSGKTTQLNLLSKSWPVYTEPVHLWPLDEFYSDPKNQGFHMQTAVLATFSDNGPGVYERSPRSSKEIFSNFEGKPAEQMTYDLLYHRLGWDPDYWIFLESDPELCFKKVQGRRGPGDSYVTLEYIKKIDKKYRDFQESVSDRSFVVNADRPVHEVYDTITTILRALKLEDHFL